MASRVWAAIALCSITLGAASQVAEPQAETPFQVSDVAYIDVYRHEDMSTSAIVDERGNITLTYLPFPGTVYVLGMTPTEASERVAHALTSILRQPQATVRRGGSGAPRSGGRAPDMKTELIELNNSQADSLSQALQGMSSDGGTISYDPNSNTLIITDTPAAIDNIRNTIGKLDELQAQRTQVQIETKVAEIQVGAFKELGVRWFAQGNEVLGGYYPQASQTVQGNLLRGPLADPRNNENIAFNSNSNQGSGLADIGRRFIGDNTFDRRLNVPIQVPTVGQLFFGLFNEHVDIGTLLDALIADNRGELLANPSVLCINHRQSEIRMVDEFPFTEFGTEVSGRSTTETRFLDLGIVLRVTPHVYSDDAGPYVRLDLEPEVSFPIGTSNGVPIRSVRSYSGMSNVRDGQTLVVGGIYRNDTTNVEQRVPGLGKVPIIGHLFKRTEKNKAQRELMIMVTPTIHESPESVRWDSMLNLTSVTEAGDATIVEKDKGARKE